MGWLHATPDKKTQSRLAELGEDNLACEMPSADSLLVSWFHQIGKCSSNGMGIISISFQELAAFDKMYQLNLTPWESEQIIIMSRSYSHMLTAAKDPFMSAPWHSEYYDELEEARARVMRNGKNLAKVINKSKESKKPL